MTQIHNVLLSQKGISTKYWDVIQVILASCFIGLCAQIKVPLYFTPVPFTGQTFGVMLIGALLGRRKGVLAALFYLIQGGLGYPVFAGGASGFHCFLGPTGGYLLSYPLEAYLFGFLFEREKDHLLIKTIAAILIAYVQLAIGSIWLIPFLGIKSILPMGFYPFVFVDAAKASIVCLIFKSKNGEKK
ncbi:MAG: Biotin transporter BioY2 [Chlamydiae bacterium]|nr:Biotin transporter BioY2 [Chlamydiota bacterium]